MRAEFRKQLALRAGSRAWVVALGVVGFIAGAIIFVMIGVFLVIAALQFNSGQAAGLSRCATHIEAAALWVDPTLRRSHDCGLFSFWAFSIQ